MKKYGLMIIVLLAMFSTFASARKLRLLAIGNSFSEDAVEQNLYELCLEGKDTLIIGNAYQSGYSLKMHWDDVVNKSRKIEYCKVLEGKRHIYKGFSLDSVLSDEPWDIIVLQQVSQDAGDYSTYEPALTDLLQHLKEKAVNHNLTIGFHQTWAYAKKSTHRGFAKYNNNQNRMYKSIVRCVKKVKAHHPEIAFIIPCGTAIQNARTSIIGDNLNRDGFHLNYTVGRYTAACTWAEIITGKSVVGDSFCPKGIDDNFKRCAQMAAHAAVLRPYKVTKIK